jgi:hypothetical protein
VADIGFYLAELLMVIVATYTLVSLVPIGRGVFCGCVLSARCRNCSASSPARWAAAMEPLGGAGLAVPGQVHRGGRGAGPGVDLDQPWRDHRDRTFKTAITHYRAWPYVIYAGVLLAIGLFSERAYCRFLCLLGGVLAVLDRLHLIDLLKRRPECGNRADRASAPARCARSRRPARSSPRMFPCLDCQSSIMTTSAAAAGAGSQRRGGADAAGGSGGAMAKHSGCATMHKGGPALTRRRAFIVAAALGCR